MKRKFLFSNRKDYFFKRPVFILLTGFLLLAFSCKPVEEVGLAQYFIENNSDYTIIIQTHFVKSVVVNCDSCTINQHTSVLLGHDSNFGHAPNPDETIKQIRIYKNDTLKIIFDSPFGDSAWTAIKGINRYDYDFKLKLTDADLN